jgi:hypothetical protein
VWLNLALSRCLSTAAESPPQQREQSSGSHSHACQSHRRMAVPVATLLAVDECERKVAAGLAGAFSSRSKKKASHGAASTLTADDRDSVGGGGHVAAAGSIDGSRSCSAH